VPQLSLPRTSSLTVMPCRVCGARARGGRVELAAGACNELAAPTSSAVVARYRPRSRRSEIVRPRRLLPRMRRSHMTTLEISRVYALSTHRA